MFNNIEDVLKKLLNDDGVASQLGNLMGDYQNQDKGGGGALDLTQYQRNAFQGVRFEDGGVAGNSVAGGGSDPGFSIDEMLSDLGLDPETYKTYRNLVINHETGGTFDPRQMQLEGGPGRGLFQFEGDSVETATARLKTYFRNKGMEVPDFLGKTKDATELPPQQQELLFIGQMMNKVQDKDEEEGIYKVELNSAFKKDEWKVSDYADAWIKTHNKTSGGERKDRIDNFTADSKLVFEGAADIYSTEQIAPYISRDSKSEAQRMELPGLDVIQGMGVPQAGLGKFFKKRWNDVKKIGEGAFEVVKGSADWTLGLAGAGDVIQDTWVDRSKFLSGANDIVGKIGRTALDVVVPGAGTALGAVGGAANDGVNNGRANKEAKQKQGEYNDSAAGGMEQLMSIFGGGGQGMGQSMGGQNPMGFLSQFMSGNFENGGITQVVPEGVQAIQTEKYKGKLEQLIFSDGMISDVNAKESHEKMSDDQITDVVPDGTYVASARSDMKIKRSSLEDIVFGYESLPYEEHAKGTIPKMVTAADIVPKKTKKLTPSEYAKYIKKEYEVIDEDDPFMNAANTQNLQARLPFIQTLVSMGEANRMSKEAGQEMVFKDGGYVQKYPEGGISGSAIGAGVGMAGSLIGGIAGMVNASAQRKELERQQAALSGLTGNLQGLNNQSTAVGVAGQLAQQTDLPSLDLDFSRLENFNTQTPQSFIDAAARPVSDVGALTDRLGERAGVAAFANQSSQQMQARNQAAAQAFQNDRNTSLSLAQQLTQGYNRETEFNNNLRQQEIASRNNVFNNIAGQIQGGIQNNANIQSSSFSANQDLALQRASMKGQGAAAFGQSLVNAAGIGISQFGESTFFGGSGGGGQASATNLGPNNTMNRDQISGMFPSIGTSAINVPPPTAPAFSGLSQVADTNSRYFPTDLFGGGSNYFPTNLFGSGPSTRNTYAPQQVPGASSTYRLDGFNFGGLGRTGG
jgi:hypothetical protein